MPLRVLAAALLFSAGCAAPVAGPSGAQARTEAALATLLAVAAAPDTELEAVAPLVVAYGGDADRRWRAPADLARPVEARAVQDALDELRRILSAVSRDDGFGYTVEEFVVERESEGEWHALRVRFHDAAQTEILAAFLPIGGAMLLGDIDR